MIEKFRRHIFNSIKSNVSAQSATDISDEFDVPDCANEGRRGLGKFRFYPFIEDSYVNINYWEHILDASVKEYLTSVSLWHFPDHGKNAFSVWLFVTFFLPGGILGLQYDAIDINEAK